MHIPSSSFSCRFCPWPLFRRSLSSLHTKEIPKYINLLNQNYAVDKAYNLNPKVLSCLGKNLHRKEQHPLCLLKRNIENFFIRRYTNGRGDPVFSFVDNLSPIVSTEQNFDSLLIPQSHPSRRPEDTYYVNEQTVLRSHTSAHQVELIKSGIDAFLCFGDTYRRDAVDRTHYPVFHQVEGVRLFSPGDLADLSRAGKPDPQLFVAKNHGPGREPSHQELHSVEAAETLEKNLKGCLEDLCKHIFGSGIQFRWVNEYFPFTHPSWELEIFWQGYWLEVLGCGLVEQQILKNSGTGDYLGWAFGMGLERLAMALYEIPDIRIFWSEDERFLSQFANAKPETRLAYKAVSTQPPVFNDMSFWLSESFVPTDFFDLVRHCAGDIIESVVLRDEFKKNGKTSHCYRFTYRSPTQALTQEEVTKVHEEIRSAVRNQLGVQLRV